MRRGDDKLLVHEMCEATITLRDIRTFILLIDIHLKPYF